MQAEPASKILSLIEAGDYVFNVRYMIMRRRVGKSDPRNALDVHLEEGIKVRLKGDDARLFDRRLARLIPDDEDDPAGAVGPVQVSVAAAAKKGRPPGPTEGG